MTEPERSRRAIPPLLWIRERLERYASPRSVVAITALAVVVAGGLIGYVARNPQDSLRALPGVSAIVPIDPPDYDSSFFGLRAPLSVAVSTDGRLMYVAEGTGDRVVRVVEVSSGENVGSLLPPLTTPGMRKPVSVATTPDGLVYVVDRIRRTVDVYDAEGRWIANLPAPVSEDIWNPLSVDTDSDGRGYVTNTGDGGPVLTVYAIGGQVEETFEEIVVDGLPLSFPNSIARSDDEQLVIGDSNNSRIVVFDLNTRVARAYGNIAPNALAIPRGVVIDGNGLSLVVDANDHTISAWDWAEDRPRLFGFGEPGIGDGAFLFPNDIAIGPNGSIYIADRDNDRIQVWRY